MASLRELRSRIRSVNSTKKITKAQELIATSRITKAQAKVEAAEPYATEIHNVMERLASASSLDHPMLRERENAKRAAVLVISSDRGMCGGYNYNIFKKAAELEKNLEDHGYEVVRYVSGNKGVGYYNFRSEPFVGSWSGFSQDPSWKDTHNVRRHLIDGFLASSEGTAKYRPGLTGPEGKAVQGFDSVHVVYTEFESMLTQTPRVHQLLPIEPVIESEELPKGEDYLDASSSSDAEPDYEFEPDADTLIASLLPKYVSRSLFAMHVRPRLLRKLPRLSVALARSPKAEKVTRL